IEGMVNVASATEVVDVAVIVGIGPSYKTTGGKVDAHNKEPDGVNAAVGERVGVDKYKHAIYQMTRGISSGQVGK
ncbi:hypothetical protein KI387_038143, partial [Taxus chinensis]